MRRVCWLLAVLILAAAGPATADTIYVDLWGAGDYTTIGEAIAAAADGDTVLVGPGWYDGPMNRDLQLTTKELVIRSTHGPDETTIDCQNAGRGFNLLLITNTSPTIEGFEITNGSVPGGQGGAILCSHGSPIFRNLRINSNHALYGGGMYCSASEPTLDDVWFVDNRADSLGGGMACEYGGDATITNSRFILNVAGEYGVPELNDAGGGLYVFNSDVILNTVTIANNYAGNMGGGLCVDATWELWPTAATLESVTLDVNESPYGGGAYFRGARVSILGSLILWNASTGSGGGLLIVDGQGEVTLSNTSFRDNTTSQSDGGGLYVNETGPGIMTIDDCEFLRNAAPTGYGGGAYIRNSAPTIHLSVFSENTAENGGGAMVHCSLSDPVFSYCTFAENEATVEGAGVYVHTQCSATLENTIVAFGQGGGSVGCGPDATLSLFCSDVYGNVGGDWIGCIASQYGTWNNFSENPLFCGEANPEDPLSLHSSSPCSPWGNPACGQVGARPVGCHFPVWNAYPEGLEFVVGPNQKSCQELVLVNSGDGYLHWELGVVRAGRASEQAPTSRATAPAARSTRAAGKGRIDDAVGAPVLRGWGGPDAGGYTWTDSDEPGGPTFDWQDISTIGTEIFLDDDDYAGTYLPFAFPFYGEPQWFVNICSNGLLAFGPLGPQHYINRPIPTAGSTDNLVAPFWEDLNPEIPPAAIHYHYDESADRFIVQYTAVPHFDGPGEGLYTFQVILRPDGTIVHQYLDMQGLLDGATVGVEAFSDPPIGLEVVYNAPYVHNGLAVEIAPWITAYPPSGVIPPGGERVVEVCVRSTGLEPGQAREALLSFVTNDPGHPEPVVPVAMYVTETGVEEEILSDVPVFRGIYPNPFNPSTTIAYDLPEPARVSVTVYDVSGRLVRVLRDDVPEEAGSHATIWNGLDASGQRVASGVYLCRLEVDGVVFAKRMVLLK